MACVLDAVLGQSLPRHRLESRGSSRQLAAQYHNTVHEEPAEDTSCTDHSRVFFDVGDDE